MLISHCIHRVHAPAVASCVLTSWPPQSPVVVSVTVLRASVRKPLGRHTGQTGGREKSLDYLGVRSGGQASLCTCFMRYLAQLGRDNAVPYSDRLGHVPCTTSPQWSHFGAFRDIWGNQPRYDCPVSILSRCMFLTPYCL